MLAGCPIIGLRNAGAALVRDGSTGIVIPRIPPGIDCCKSQQDRADLVDYLRAVDLAIAMDRKQVREAAAAMFDTEKIVGTILLYLEQVRANVAKAKAG